MKETDPGLFSLTPTGRNLFAYVLPSSFFLSSTRYFLKKKKRTPLPPILVFAHHSYVYYVLENMLT